MDVKEIVRIQLDACHTENSWFVSLINSIEGISEEQATWKANDMTNSIFEIINHLIYYNQRLLNRFKNSENEDSSGESTFRIGEGANWEDATAKIYEVMSEWKTAVEESGERNLHKWASHIAHLTIHTTYHTGQILYIRKLQGSWDPKEGVKG